MPLTFHFCDSVTSWRHVMTSLNLIHLSQLVEELESSFFFCLHGFVGHWVQNDWWFLIRMISWRHDVMSWRHKNCSTYLRLWIHWKDDRVQDSTVFLVAHSRNVSVRVFVGWYHVMTSRHDVDVMTSRQYLTSPCSTYLSCSWALLRLLYKFYANLGCKYQTNHRYYFPKLPPAWHNDASWRHDVTSCHRMKLKQY